MQLLGTHYSFKPEEPFWKASNIRQGAWQAVSCRFGLESTRALMVSRCLQELRGSPTASIRFVSDRQEFLGSGSL
jgi:hypothetical protein